MNLSTLIGETLDDKYLIERQLGKGGMGAVFLAIHVGTERPVALKLIAPQLMQVDEFVERFRREARAAGRLRHPNVVDVTDFGFAKVGPARVAYLVMEYLDGCTLDEVLDEEERLPLAWVVDILEQTCSAVEEAHQQGIIHRDLKPDNIWLEPNRRGGYTVKVLDFGIAKLEEHTDHGMNHDGVSGHAFNAARQSLRLGVVRGTVGGARGTEHQAATAADHGNAPTKVDSVAAYNSALEGDTLIAAAPAPTLVQPIARAAAAADGIAAEEAGTQIFDDATQRYSSAQVSHADTEDSNLTRVGSLLGTPIYMSPEQCAGGVLDQRSDVYSLGVIAYQMLSGKPPFAGGPVEIMRQHQEVAPQPLVTRGVPRKARRVIMSALAKTPEQRPASAAALAGALRAHTQGVGALLQQAATIYISNLPVFLRLSLIVHVPLAIVTVIQILESYSDRRNWLPFWLGIVAKALLGVLSVIISFSSAYLMLATTTWLVTQFLAAPLRPLKLLPAFLAAQSRMRNLILTGLFLFFITVGGLIMLVIPGLLITLVCALTVPALMMENLRTIPAVKRSYELVIRSKRTVIAIFLLQFIVPLCLASLTTFVLAAVVKAFAKGHAQLVNDMFQLIWLPAQVLLSSLASITTALLYLKTRMAGGETVRGLIRQFEETDTTRSGWQQRMRERLSLSTRVSG